MMGWGILTLVGVEDIARWMVELEYVDQIEVTILMRMMKTEEVKTVCRGGD